MVPKQTTMVYLAGAAGEGDIVDNPHGHHGPPTPNTTSSKWRGECARQALQLTSSGGTTEGMVTNGLPHINGVPMVERGNVGGGMMGPT